jgi:hypothetical protein
MSAGELIVSHEGPPVALGMTSASFDSAQRLGVVGIEVDTDAIQYIAREVGYTKPTEALSPLVMVTRESGQSRVVIARWDDRLPFHQGSPNTGRFFIANHLDRQTPSSANRELFVEVARTIGAPALTEVSVANWLDETTHAGDIATGLLLGQRPLDLPPKPSALGKMKGFFKTETREVDAIKAVRADRSMPKPFIITRQPKRPELENQRQIGQ